ncbi:MAG TPA: DUF971 domain-containing protein [Sedimenticola sp.]|nr:DUF971 domain-containing protein [Sedimenticola sp.]
MTEQTQTPQRVPVEINLHSKSRLLIVEFSDGRRFELPCEYLRVFSRAKEVRTLEEPPVGKEAVNSTGIEPQGQDAVRLLVDDGHDTGIYSWDTLYELGEKQEENWQAYLARLKEIGYTRREPGSGPRRIRILYFTYLVKQYRRESEQVEVPESVTSVETLLAWLRKRKPELAHLLREDAVRVTVNRQFSEPFTRIDDGDEVALVPTSPIAPVPD